MNIVYITDQLYLHGGAERVLSNKVNYLSEFGDINVYIITTEQKGKKPCYAINPEVTLKDLNIHYHRNKSYFSPLNLLKAPRHFYKLLTQINTIEPSVIITLSSQFDYYFLPFIKRKIPKLKEFHSSRHYYHEKRRDGFSLKNIVYKFNDYAEKLYSYNAILTNDEKNYFSSSNTVVIPNALSNFPEGKAKLKNKKIISAGRIAPVKGFESLIKAWAKIIKNRTDWVLEIYGDGEDSYVQSLKQLISDNSLKKNIIIYPATHELEKKMQEASFYVMTSQTECFPMVLLEAMAVGLPIVSFDCPNGPKNIITHNLDGLLVPNRNINALSDAMTLLIENESLRVNFGKNALVNVQKYDKEIIMKKWLKLFKYNH